MEKEPTHETDMPQGGLKTAKHHYLMQESVLTPSEKQHRALLEHAMEKTVSQLPPDMQVLARTNFYQSQVREIAEKHAVLAGREADTGIDR